VTDRTPVAFDGAVLAGGASRRMGRDKAFVEAPDGRPLVLVAAEGLLAAGAGRVVVVGGDEAAVGALGLAWTPDLHPGEGPLGGIVTALRDAPADPVVVVACDMPGFTEEVPTALVAALDRAPDADVALAAVGERLQPLTAAWRRSAIPVLEAAFSLGERAPRRILDRLEVVAVPGLARDLLDDVDSPEDLRRYADRRPSPPTRTGSP
jgi:molybdopterin-guanine dinucleotide biosynthesis protein A